jgi:pimeloyl-ACP methyl ester carboxylesterase
VAASISRRTRHVALVVAGLLTFIILAGVTYQSVATALERRQFPYPGRLIDIGGHQLHLNCQGEGSPIVILEAGAGGFSSGWAWVQQALRQTTRVCSYDRAGLGWSEAGETAYRAERVSEDLHALLERAGERGPFIMAGHELGAAFARMYAARYRDEVAALVLVDDPSQRPGAAGRRAAQLARTWPWLARVGVLRVSRTLSKRARELPDVAGGAARAFLNRPDHLARGAIEIARFRNTVAQADAWTIDASLLVTQVTTAGQDPPALLASEETARAVTRALQEIVRRVRP